MKRRHAESEFAAVAVRKSKMVTVVAVVILDLVLVVARKAVQEAKVVAVVVREMVGEQIANVISTEIDHVQRSKVTQIKFLQSRRGMHRICANQRSKGQKKTSA